MLNKTDLLDEAALAAQLQRVREGLGWQGELVAISAATGAGCAALVEAIMVYLERHEPSHVEAAQAVFEPYDPMA